MFTNGSNRKEEDQKTNLALHPRTISIWTLQKLEMIHSCLSQLGCASVKTRTEPVRTDYRI